MRVPPKKYSFPRSDFKHSPVLKGLYVITALQRCFVCRSRGEMGSCKDPFTENVTLVENKQAIGIETIPCASGWCGKILESEDLTKEGEAVSVNINKCKKLWTIESMNCKENHWVNCFSLFQSMV